MALGFTLEPDREHTPTSYFLCLHTFNFLARYHLGPSVCCLQIPTTFYFQQASARLARGSFLPLMRFLPLPSPLPRQPPTSGAADTSLGAATQLASSLLTPRLQSSALNLTVKLSECHLSQEKACRRMCVQVHNYTHVHSPKLSAQGGGSSYL